MYICGLKKNFGMNSSPDFRKHHRVGSFNYYVHQNFKMPFEEKIEKFVSKKCSFLKFFE